MSLSQIFSAPLIYKVTVIVLIVVSTATVVSLFGRHPYLELTTHFRLQYALLSAICLLLLINAESWRLLPLALCCFVLNSFYILPYYSRDIVPANFKEASQLRLMQANLQGGNQNYAAIL